MIDIDTWNECMDRELAADKASFIYTFLTPNGHTWDSWREAGYPKLDPVYDSFDV